MLPVVGMLISLTQIVIVPVAAGVLINLFLEVVRKESRFPMFLCRDCPYIAIVWPERFKNVQVALRAAAVILP